MYSGYIYSIYDISGGGYLNLLLLNSIYIAYYYVKRQKQIIDIDERIKLAQIIIALFLQVLAIHMEIFGRIVPYYGIFTISMIPEILDTLFKGKNKQIAFCIVTLIMCIFFFYEFYENKAICPYYFFWKNNR